MGSQSFFDTSLGKRILLLVAVLALLVQIYMLHSVSTDLASEKARNEQQIKLTRLTLLVDEYRLSTESIVAESISENLDKVVPLKETVQDLRAEIESEVKSSDEEIKTLWGVVLRESLDLFEATPSQLRKENTRAGFDRASGNLHIYIDRILEASAKEQASVRTHLENILVSNGIMLTFFFFAILLIGWRALQATVEVRDEQQRLRALEHEMAEEEIERLSRFPRDNPNPIFQIRHDNTLLFANQASVEMFESISTNRPKNRVPDKIVEVIGEWPKRRANRQAHIGGRHYFLNLSFIDKDALSVYVNDVTELKHAQSQVHHHSKLAAIGELAAGVGHEINNPLAIANGNVEKISRELIRSDIHNSIIDDAINKYRVASWRISNIVKGLRTFARHDTDSFEPISLNGIVEQTIALIKEIYTKDGITIQQSICGQKLTIDGNVGRIQQVLMNLISNAKDALKESQSKVLTVELTKDANDAAIKVTDTGTGIDPKIQKRIFENFFTTKIEGKGTGMGLTLTTSIVKEHGGEISLESEVGKGTTFTVHFPLSKNAATQSEESPTSNSPQTDTESLVGSLSGTNALVVDDEPELREILKEILEEDFEVKVTEAANGVEALEMVQKQKFDYIFTDMKMPELDGPGLLREIDKLNLTDRPTIFVVTGGVNTDYSKESRSEISTLADGFLLKPFTPEQIAKLFADRFNDSRDNDKEVA